MDPRDARGHQGRPGGRSSPPYVSVTASFLADLLPPSYTLNRTTYRTFFSRTKRLFNDFHERTIQLVYLVFCFFPLFFSFPLPLFLHSEIASYHHSCPFFSLQNISILFFLLFSSSSVPPLRDCILSSFLSIFQSPKHLHLAPYDVISLFCMDLREKRTGTCGGVRIRVCTCR